jgi:predicted DNA-binding transcriptional regulator AlpA
MSEASKQAAAVEIGARIVKLGGLQSALLAQSVARLDDSAADTMLTPEDVARRLGVTTLWVYKNWKTRLPFGVKVSHKAVRFSARKLERWLSLRRVGR